MSVLVNALLKENLVTDEQLSDAKDKQIGAKKPIQELLVEMGFVGEEDLIRLSSRIFDTPILDLKKETIDPSIMKLLSYETAKRYGVFPVRKEDDMLVLAMSDPQDVIALDDIRMITNMKIKPVLSTKSKIAENIEECYNMDDTLYDLVKNIAEDAEVEVIKEEKPGNETGDQEETDIQTAPVVRMVNLILNDAIKNRASDIHIEPQEEFTEIRYRVDGELRNIMRIPAKLHASFVTRIKLLAELDIAEKRKPQDGRISISVSGREVDLRISTVPSFYGENVVARLLDKKEAVMDLDKIGFQKKERAIFLKAAVRPQGMILVTGPTGSGKTSTLYAVLNHVKSEAKNIITIEDPIEYLLEGVNQIQVNPVKNLTFATGLRTILRQDPNVILVGEIRDKETAEIAFRSSQTGHLVFSTLHTNSSIASITRLRDIGLEPYLISSSIILITAQRLVRRICPGCKEEYTPGGEFLEGFKAYRGISDINKFYRGKGCEKCGFTGLLGRIAIFEMLKFDEKIKVLVSDGAGEDQIFKAAREEGFKTLIESGIEKVAEGITTLEEIEKVVGIEEKSAQSSLPQTAGIRENPKIVVADDEDDIRKILVKRLRTAGYDVIEAVNGKEAVERVSKEKPDLVIMDIMMPEMNGIEATRVIRSRLETAVIPVLMLTARKDKESELKGLDAGADDYVTKPYDNDKLLARARMLLRRGSGADMHKDVVV